MKFTIQTGDEYLLTQLVINPNVVLSLFDCAQVRPDEGSVPRLKMTRLYEFLRGNCPEILWFMSSIL